VARWQRRCVESSAVLARYAAAFAERLAMYPRVVERTDSTMHAMQPQLAC